MGKEKPTFISLFSGCGGFDLGFVNAGFQNLGAFDIDSTALQVHEVNIGGPSYKCDLSSGNVPINQIERADIILSGSPCQGFSTLGKRDLDDPRNHLLLVGGLLAAKSKPKVFIAENVPGVIAGKHKKYWDELHVILRNAGYKTKDVVLNGIELGIAQQRKRVILIAWRENDDFLFSLPKIAPVTLSEALHGVHKQNNHEVKNLPKDSIDYLIAKRIKQDQKLSNVRGGARSIHTWEVPEVFGETTEREKFILESVLKMRRQIRTRDFGDADPVPAEIIFKNFGKREIACLLKKGFLRKNDDKYDLTGAFNGKYRRLSWDKPSYTVDTRFGNPKYFLHPNEHRGFSVREAARIQGFPDSFIFSGTQTEQYKMVGNAVPPTMAFHLANVIKGDLIE